MNDHKTQGEWRIHSGNTIARHITQTALKIQLTIAINRVRSKPGSDETRIMHTKSYNVEIMMGSQTDEIIEGLFRSLLQRYQERLEESMRGSGFIFYSIDAPYYDLNKVSLSRGRSYIDSPEWLKNKKATTNPKNNDDKCFQYALTVALNYKQIKSQPERISNIKPFFDQYNWKEIDFPLYKNQLPLYKNQNQLLSIFCMCHIILKK